MMPLSLSENPEPIRRRVCGLLPRPDKQNLLLLPDSPYAVRFPENKAPDKNRCMYCP